MSPTPGVAPAVCFDATGTLIETARPIGETYRRVALDHGIDLPAWRIEDAFRRILAHAPPRGTEGETPAERRRAETRWWFERIRQTFQATDSTVRFEDFEGFATALFETYRSPRAWRLRAGAREMLCRLEGLECPMAIVSNFDHRLPDILQGLGILDFFRTVLIPSSTGFRKPDHRLFEVAAGALERPLASIVYVGDDEASVLENIAGHGLRVIDVREGGGLEGLPDRIARLAIVPEPSERS
ncbi:MAG TPA: HAD family hydrolase [Deltaproteobacteria bacterium]|nr:HAD family hydrolase [Deltaproteobacteria bacterium]